MYRESLEELLAESLGRGVRIVAPASMSGLSSYPGSLEGVDSVVEDPDRPRQTPEQRQRGGRHYDMGETFRQPDLHQTLVRIAKGGADEFYKGKTARLIAADMQKNGGSFEVTYLLVDQQGNIVPGLAESWESNKDLTAWVFRLRQGVLFHNGREVDAESIKLNFQRIKDPTKGGDWERGAIANVDSVEVIDRYTLRIKAKTATDTISNTGMS